MGFFLWFIFKLLPFFFFILFGVFILNNNYFFSYTFKFKVFFLFIYNCFYFLYKLIFLKNYFFKKYFCNYYLWLASYRCQWQHAGLKYIFFLCAALPKFCYRARVGVCVYPITEWHMSIFMLMIRSSLKTITLLLILLGCCLLCFLGEQI